MLGSVPPGQEEQAKAYAQDIVSSLKALQYAIDSRRVVLPGGERPCSTPAPGA